MLNVLLLLAGAATAGFLIDSLSSDDDANAAPEDDMPDEDEQEPGTSEITGSMLDDLLMGTEEDDSISGRDGDDTLSGLDGNDTLRGEGGDEDRLYGGNGDDLLIDGTINSDGTERGVGSGASVLNVTYEDGGDLYGEGGNDTILVTDGDGYGGDGDDSLSNWDERLLGDIAETGYDQVEQRPIGGPSQIHPSLAPQNNNLYGGDGDDSITSAQGNAFGEAGNDTIFGYGVDATEDARDEAVTSANFTISGGDGDDDLTGVASNVYGDKGNDVLNGSFSNLFGGEGDDTIHTHDMHLDVNDGLVYDGGDGNDVFTASNPAAGFLRDGYSSETYLGGAGDDFIDARGSADLSVVDPGEGADTIFADARNSVADADSWASSARFEITGFDSAEDMLIVDVGVDPVTPGTLPADPVDLDVELVDRSDADGVATEVRITLADTSQVSLADSGELDEDARFILLNGVAPDDVNLDSLHIRAVFDGMVLSQDGFPALADDPDAPSIDVGHVAPEIGVIAPLQV